MECCHGVILYQHLVGYVDAQGSLAIAKRQRCLSAVRLASPVSHISLHHKVVEHRILCLRHRQWHLYSKVSIGISGSLATIHLCAIIAVAKCGLVVISAVTHPPECSTAHHLIAHLGILHRHTCIAQCRTPHVDCVASLVSLLVLVKVYVECWALILLYAYPLRVVVHHYVELAR